MDPHSTSCPASRRTVLNRLSTPNPPSIHHPTLTGRRASSRVPREGDVVERKGYWGTINEEDEDEEARHSPLQARRDITRPYEPAATYPTSTPSRNFKCPTPLLVELALYALLTAALIAVAGVRLR